MRRTPNRGRLGPAVVRAVMRETFGNDISNVDVIEVKNGHIGSKIIALFHTDDAWAVHRMPFPSKGELNQAHFSLLLLIVVTNSSQMK